MFRAVRLASLFFSCLLFGVGCTPLERARDCEAIVQTLAPINGLELKADGAADYLTWASRVEEARNTLMRQTPKRAELEKLRQELLAHLDSLKSALRQAGEELGDEHSRQFRTQRTRAEHQVEQLQGIALRFNSACK